MEIQTRKKSTAITMTVDGELTIYTVSDFKERFLAEAAGFREVVIDLSHVARLDTAGFQALQMARRAAESDGMSIRFADPSQDVRRLFAVYRENIEDWSAYGGREKA